MIKRDEIRAKIAARHDNPLLRTMIRTCEKFLRAYNNQLNWNVEVNGEANALRMITRALHGDVFDVGANEGQWATMALRTIGNKRLHCFEVIPLTFQSLKEKVGSSLQVTCNNFGLGSHNSKIDMYYYPDSTDRTSAYYIDDGLNKEKTQISVMRGDDYIKQREISQISFLKIDVEGMEMDVLIGLERSFKARIIKAVQFEHGPAHIISRHFLRDFSKFFEAYDFELFRCYPHGLRKVNYDIGRDESFVGENFVSIARECSRSVAVSP